MRPILVRVPYSDIVKETEEQVMLKSENKVQINQFHFER